MRIYLPSEKILQKRQEGYHHQQVLLNTDLMQHPRFDRHHHSYLILSRTHYKLKWTAETGSEWADKVLRHLPVFTSPYFHAIKRSWNDEVGRCMNGSKSAWILCPLSVFKHFPDLTSQSFRVLSSEAKKQDDWNLMTRQIPDISRLCPLSAFLIFSIIGSQIIITLSAEELASHSPLGLNPNWWYRFRMSLQSEFPERSLVFQTLPCSDWQMRGRAGSAFAFPDCSVIMTLKLKVCRLARCPVLNQAARILASVYSKIT